MTKTTRTILDALLASTLGFQCFVICHYPNVVTVTCTVVTIVAFAFHLSLTRKETR